MSKFITKTTPLNNFNPFKRVDYPFGMLLSPAEFIQEQLYFVERNRLHHRLLHGYGTVCGLKVIVKGDDEIRVSAGLAIDVLGKLIRVENEKCASLKLWLKEHSDEFSDTSPPVSPPYNLYIVLCYRECPSDKVLIRTSPCQPKEQSENYSRIQESSEIKIITKEPLQKEEDIIRNFGDIFAGIPVSKDASSVDLGEYKKKIADLVRSLDDESSPPATPSSTIGQLNPQDAETLFRHAFKIWVTEVKSKLVLGEGCLNDNDINKNKDNCVLLAQLIVDENGQVTINEENRPYLLSTRLIQEYFLNRSQGEALGVASHHSLIDRNLDDHPQYLTEAEGNALYSPVDHSHQLNDLSDVNSASANDKDVLTRQGGAWVTGKINHADLNDLDQDHHSQYLLTDGKRPLDDNWNVGNKKITNLKDATKPKDALNLGKAYATFVEGGAGPYQIVAAGRFDVDGNSKGAVYGELKVTEADPNTGDYTLHFPKYKNPDHFRRKHTYIVKFTSEGNDATFKVLDFMADAKGIKVSISGGGTGFMVEISCFGLNKPVPVPTPIPTPPRPPRPIG